MLKLKVRKNASRNWTLMLSFLQVWQSGRSSDRRAHGDRQSCLHRINCYWQVTWSWSWSPNWSNNSRSISQNVTVRPQVGHGSRCQVQLETRVSWAWRQVPLGCHGWLWPRQGGEQLVFFETTFFYSISSITVPPSPPSRNFLLPFF